MASPTRTGPAQSDRRRGYYLPSYTEPDEVDQLQSKETQVRVKTQTVSIVHELGTDLTSEDIKKEAWIEPSTTWTRVSVDSRVEGQTARRMTSPAYLATVRRRRAKLLIGLLTSLEQHEHREDFSICTHPLVEGIRELILTLTDAKEEGNTREVLRRLRDTFLDGGWDRYRSRESRTVALSILIPLAETEEITPDDATRAFNELFDHGLKPMTLTPFEDDGEGEEIDVEEGEVSD
jgi:hypothetical protein